MLSDRPYMQADYGQPQTFRPFRAASAVTVLIWINVAVFILDLATEGRLGMLLALNPEAVRAFQLWRLMTYMFVHGGLMHLLLNMWGLFLFGRMIEQHIGRFSFVKLYLVSGLIGGLTWLGFNWTAGEYANVVGASGALFGVMVAAALLFPNERILLLLPPVVLKLKTFVVIYAVVEIIFELTSLQRSVAHLAHLGGMLGGFIYMRHLFPALGRFRPWQSLTYRWHSWRHRRQRKTALGDSAEEYNEAFFGEVDRILDKIGRDGLSSLTPEESRLLEKARERLKDRRR